MIAKLHGIIDPVAEDWCVIDVNEVGYMVSASARTLSKLYVGAEATLFTVMTVREDDISLYGFADMWEKAWFSTLTKVQGVGAKVCLSILSALTPLQLAQAINAQDKALFCRANGVGPQLAARIVTELKDKIVTIPVVSGKTAEAAIEGTENVVVENIETNNQNYAKTEDVTSALINLGYQRIEAYHAASKAIAENADADIGELIRLALKEFANKEF